MRQFWVTTCGRVDSFCKNLVFNKCFLGGAAAAKSLQSDSLQPHRWQPTRGGLPFPSPMHESEKWKWSRSVVSNSSQPHGLQPTRLLHPWDFPSKSIGASAEESACQRIRHDLASEHSVQQVFPFSRWKCTCNLQEGRRCFKYSCCQAQNGHQGAPWAPQVDHLRVKQVYEN